MMAVTVSIVIMGMVVVLFEQESADKIDGQRNAGDANRFVEVDLKRNKKSMDRFTGHQKCNH